MMEMKSRKKKMSTWFIVGLVLLVAAVVAPAMAAELSDVDCPTGLESCTANEVTTTLVSYDILSPNEACEADGTIHVSLTVDFSANADRYDLGMFVAKDGGTLSDDPTAEECSGAYGAIPPFANLDSDTDTCGDIDSKVNDGVVTETFEVRVDCDTIDDGTLEISSCRFWEQPGANEACSGVPGQNAGTGSKCDCTPFIVEVNPTATLTLDKIVDGGTAAESEWTLTADGTATNDLSGPGAAGNTDVTGIVTPDTFALSESAGPAGYSASAWSCSGFSNGGSQNGDSVTLGAGESVVCTITNTFTPTPVPPTLTLIKIVDNGNGGTKGIGDFTLQIDGNAVTSGVSNEVSPGDHTASEIEVPGYSASAWGGDCAADGSVTLANGEDKTCTITNTFTNVPVPEFPSLALPAAMVIGLLGAVLLIQRSKE